MASGFHAVILATALVATLAVGLASASILIQDDAAPKADRLPVMTSDNANYVTVETRDNGVSILSKVKIN